MSQQVDWTMEVNPDWPEAHWTAKVGGLKLCVYDGGRGSDWVVVRGSGHTVAEGRCWGAKPIEKAKAAAEAVARIESEGE